MNTEIAYRQTYLDVLKTISVFFVVVVHISAINFSRINIETANWFACNVYDSIAHFSAPVLFMISGALFLNPKKKVTITTIWKKNILRIFIAFFFWSITYAVAEIVLKSTNNNVFDSRVFLMAVIKGHYHLWFCHAIIFCYIVTPILRQIIIDENIRKYLLYVSITIVFIVNFFKFIPLLDVIFTTICADAGIVFGGYVCYFILGHYLNQMTISVKWGGISVIGLIALAITITGTAVLSWNYGKATEMLYGYLLPNTLLWSSSVFVLVKKYMNNMSKKSKLLYMRLANHSFGAYLVHVFVYNALLKIGLTPTICNSFIAIPILSITTWTVSIMVSVIIKRIPMIGYFIV